MKTTSKYIEIKNTEPKMHECFFAFNPTQFEQGRKRANIPAGKKIYRAEGGLFGTKEGLDRYYKELDKIIGRIPKECDPQDVYDYEFDNHECGYTRDDMPAIKLVVAYFGEERARTVKRRSGCDHAKIKHLFNPVS